MATTKTKATELAVDGRKKISTLYREFNRKFPYLMLRIFAGEAREKAERGERITPIDQEQTLASVRRVNAGGTISISGNKKIKTLEREFDTVFGLYAQVCYTSGDGKKHYTSGSHDEMTLTAFNRDCEARGCKADAW